jgi:hypothetical protein
MPRWYIAYVAAFIALGLLIGAAVGAWQWMMTWTN